MKNEVKHLAHSSYRCEYRIVFAPKYRREIEDALDTLPASHMRPKGKSRGGKCLPGPYFRIAPSVSPQSWERTFALLPFRFRSAASRFENSVSE